MTDDSLDTPARFQAALGGTKDVDLVTVSTGHPEDVSLDLDRVFRSALEAHVTKTLPLARSVSMPRAVTRDCSAARALTRTMVATVV